MLLRAIQNTDRVGGGEGEEKTIVLCRAIQNTGKGAGWGEDYIASPRDVGGSVAEWSARRTRNPAVPGSSPALATCWICARSSRIQILGHACK